MTPQTIYHRIRMDLLERMPYSEVIHIGSTAIEGLKTKGDLDINLRVTQDKFWESVNEIIKMGYFELDGTLQCDSLRHLKPINKYEIDVAIQVTVIGSEHDTFVIFNEILRFNNYARKEYEVIKTQYGFIPDDDYREKKAIVINKYLNFFKQSPQQGASPDPSSPASNCILREYKNQ
ncbi:MAG: GrpB family protein [Candidatus Riflebacteria bacterium]|nr:GrpB family protein [Candidatus Riflebacteria bacterium]